MIQIDEKQVLEVTEAMEKQAARLQQSIIKMDEIKTNVQKHWISEASDITQQKVQQLEQKCGTVQKEMLVVFEIITEITAIIKKQETEDAKKAGILFIGD